MKFNPKIEILKMASAHILARSIYAAAKLHIADHLIDGSMSIKALAQKTNTHSVSLYRLLRMLASHGIFQETNKEEFGLTPMAKCLCSKGADSIRDIVMGDDDRRWNAVGHLDLAVSKGFPAFDLLYGQSYFEYLVENPERGAVFDAQMSRVTQEENQHIIQSLQINPADKIVDVGGGRGGFLAQVLEKYSNSQGILFDLPGVVNHPSAVLLDNVKNRCNVVAGNFFEQVPEGADAYLFKRVLHDWDDEACQTILANCRKAMSRKAKIYIFEGIIPEGNQPHLTKDIDIFLMSIFSGRERTLSEFQGLIESQDLKIDAIQPTNTYLSIIEVVPSR